jgi:integrase
MRAFVHTVVHAPVRTTGLTSTVEDEVIHRKPHFSTLKESTPRNGFLEHHKFLQLLALLEPLRPPVQFAYLLRWRIKSEVLPLQWSQVDLAEGTVWLDAGTTKNNQACLVPLPAPLATLVKALPHPQGCSFVFHRNGKPIKDFRDAWHAACQAVGIPDTVPHNLRCSTSNRRVRACSLCS